MTTDNMRTGDDGRTDGSRDSDVIVIGAGLAGLSAAAFASRAGATVRIVDARTSIGGRARTAHVDGFRFNEGPHALFRGSDGAAALRELGLRPRGGNPPLTRTFFALDGATRRTPPATATRQVIRLLVAAGRDRHDPGLVKMSAAEWIDGRVSDPTARVLAAATLRVATYCGRLDLLSADAAAHQLHAVRRGVIYLHDGWQQLVEGIRTVAVRNGTTLQRAKVTSVQRESGRWAMITDDGTLWASSVIIAAGGPSTAVQMVGDDEQLSAAAANAAPVLAACLDLGLDRLPSPGRHFVLGLDVPTYASVHTKGARLADVRGHHVAHVMYYEPDESISLDVLEQTAEQLQPDWRGAEVARQVGLRRVVTYDRPQPGRGMAGRPGVRVDGLPGVFVAGDWVGPDDMLGTASITSGRRAGIEAAALAATARPAARHGR